MIWARKFHVSRPRLGLASLTVLLGGCAGGPAVEAPGVVAGAESAPGIARGEALDSIRRRREQAIAAYLDYLERYPSSPERHEIMRRTADLLLDRAAALSVRVGASPAGLRGDQARAGEAYAEAIGIYERLVREDPAAAKEPELSYQLARAYEEIGRPARALELLDRFVADPGGSAPRLLADAQFRRGEILFARQSFASAEAAFRAVVAMGESAPVFEQALYKLAWSLFKQARYQEALNVFFSLLDREVPPEGSFETYLESSSGAEREQLADVLRAISLCFSYLAGVDSIAAWFDRHGPRPYEDRIYEDLGALYASKELYSDAAATYLALVGRTPQHERSPRLLVEAIRLYRAAGLDGRARDTQALLVDDYGLASGFWASRRPSPDSLAALQASLVELASHHHRTALQSRDAEDYRAAERWYRSYLTGFADAPEAQAMQYGLAALLFESGRYLAAAEEFERIAYGGEGHPRGADAALSAVLAYDRYEKDLGDTGGQARWRTASALRFAERYSDHPDAARVFAQAGVDLLERNEAAAAIRVSETILATAKPSSVALRQAAWSVLAQARFLAGDDPGAEQAYREAAALLPDGDARREELARGLAAAIYRQAEARLEQGDERASARRFLEAADAARGTPLATTAEYDAASALLAAQEWREAIARLERFRTAHPGHPLREEAARKLAFAYQQSGRLAEAAAVYVRLGEGAGEEGLRRAALVRAAELYEQVGRLELASSALDRYIEQFPTPADAAIEVAHRAAELAAAAGEGERRRYWLQQVVDWNDNAPAGTRSERMRALAAQATLDLAGDLEAAFRAIRLVEPLEDNLAKKLAAMESAIERLEAAAGYGVANVDSAATYRIAQLYEALGEALRTSDRPPDLGAQETVEYERLLEEQAASFERKAVEVHRSNVQRTPEGQSDRWTEQSRQRLAELRPRPQGKETGDAAAAGGSR